MSPVARRIGRTAVPVVRLAQAAAAPAVAAVAPIANPVPATVAPAATPVSAAPMVPDIAPVPVRDFAGELARAEREHEAALARRDDEIDALRKAAQQAAVDLTDAYADAERRGYAAGQEKGQLAASEALQAQIDRVASLVVRIGQARRDLMENAEDAMVGVVFAAICRILGEQGASREMVRNVVRGAAAATRAREQLVARLHPDDAALLKDGADDGDIRISADPSVVLGGCIIDSPGGSLDARFETQLELLGAALTSARASRVSEPDAA
jgi:flagellar assembly protein FliH